MTFSLALLRGINVGGNHQIKMAALARIFADAGAEHVQTYIQSGNVVFAHPERSVDRLATLLEAAIADSVGFDVPVMLRQRPQLADIIAGNPFPDAEHNRLHVLFFSDPPAPGTIDGLDVARFAPDDLRLRGHEIYLSTPEGIGRAKLPVALGKVTPPSTARNWRSVLALHDLLEAAESAAR